jgi:hypothetical protein
MTNRWRWILALVAMTGCSKSDKPAAQPSGAVTATQASKPEERPQAPGLVVHPSSPSKWESVDYTVEAIAVVDLKPLPLEEVQHIRAIIFGKHGRIFEDSTLQDWVSSRPWYHADKTFTNARLSSNERANLDVVREAEAEKHPQVEPGDMRFYQHRVLTSAMLGTHTPQDWQVLDAEVLANHGYVWRNYTDDYGETDSLPPPIQRYFDQRYWYVRDSNYTAKDLSSIERENLDTITVGRMRQLGLSISPGRMGLFKSTALTAAMLKSTPLADLRLIRNEVYARHGRIFQTPWLASYFRQFAWYTPRTDFSDSELSSVENANIAMITTREQQLHDELSTRALNDYEVRGLRPEDARLLRNEIYARHGRRFKDPQLRGYFASFAWYKPNDRFSEDQLNAIERQNVKLIADQERGRFTEA